MEPAEGLHFSAFDLHCNMHNHVHSELQALGRTKEVSDVTFSCSGVTALRIAVQ